MFLFRFLYRFFIVHSFTTFPLLNLCTEEKLLGKFDMPLREWLVQALYLSQRAEILYTYVKKYGLRRIYVLGLFFGIFSTLPQSQCKELLSGICITYDHFR